ncbi:MAG TPA: metalloprotease TldD [candidate division Zixibacteria bacterium]|nr:metalloprotease TldD [candidate division Zixibacteria bacterium]
MAQQELVPARAFFDENFGIGARDLERVIAAALGRKADYADLYFEYRKNEGISLEEGLVKSCTQSTANGVGVRVLAGAKTGYAFTDDITVQNLEIAARTARYIAQNQPSRAPARATGRKTEAHDLYPVKTPANDVPLDQKIALLYEIDRYARSLDGRVKNVFVSLANEYKIVLIATSQGTVVGDLQPLTRLNVSCIAEERGNRQVGSFGGGGRVEFGFFINARDYERYAREAVRQALVNLEAGEAPAGTMDVVLGPGWPGILLHEAVGHGLEGDFNRKKTSAFTGRIGEKVASELCTVIDDGTIPWRRGSINVDDEGTPTQRTVLIERGVLKGYLQDRLNASLMGMAPTGNGRRESYAHIPMPRMTNTFMLAGETPPEEIIRSVKKGLYAVSFGGGQVDITSGKFVFSASEAYLIEDGKATRPVKGATLIGNGPDVLTRVTMVGTDLKLDEGVGTCGKDGQSVPVGVGLPTIRIDGLTVGGTRA